ncbi:hypothetical protein MES5069_70309 [Mesorhizobium escarrei]|uniref:Secreted protein n=1 Tax=Mesorhizobium escarrei TaxID=666018 RepID=A0ABM9EIC9_9HYPH|nr:hypothetical protein MES5069_70309 [Mesorhizobium escarrei]
MKPCSGTPLCLPQLLCSCFVPAVVLGDFCMVLSYTSDPPLRRVFIFADLDRRRSGLDVTLR